MQFSPQHAHAAYQRGQVGSANPVRIVLLLYEGAVRFSRQALESFEEPAPRGHALGRAHAIVSELLSALDYERGADIATNLASLYNFVLEGLIRANVDGDQASLDTVIPVMETLTSAWRELADTHTEGAHE
ncbi:MAG: flagellar export chaperone FliS [Myxococcota bacterium]